MAFRVARLGAASAIMVVLTSCTAASATRPTPSPSPSASASVNDSPTPTPAPTGTASATPTATTSGIDPVFVPSLGAIQMVGPRLGWAVGAHAIFTTADGAHWTKQYASTEEFVGVDFISATTGWAVATRSMLGTTDGGRSWRQLGEPQAPIRSVHFISATSGWGIAGGTDPQQIHGWLVPPEGGGVGVRNDGGMDWGAPGRPYD